MFTLGVDCGTSALKAVLVDADGAVVAAASRPIAPTIPARTGPSRTPRSGVAAMFAALGDLRRAAPEAYAAVGAIGFSGQMHAAVLLGRDGRVLRPAILHNDARAYGEAAELWERHRGLADVVGVKPMAGFTGPKLLWVKRHEPEIFAAVAHVLQTKDYLRFRLTGALAPT